MTLPSSFLQLISTATSGGELRMSMQERPMPEPKDDQVIVQVEASPINPSDQGLMFGMSDMSNVTSSGSGTDTILTAPIPEMGLRVMKARLDMPMPIGNEGAGKVVAAGASPEAQALLGKTVATMGGGMYSQYRCVPANTCLPLLEGDTAKDGASCFVNPLTALCMVENMRLDGHTGLIHTAAASNLGQMLHRICEADGVPLVNIVRKEEQAELLRGMGAKYVCNSSADDFMPSLIDAIHETGATMAFDATGGGRLGSDILTAMEQAAARTPSDYSIYGSTKPKQLFIYGGLDTSPTTLTRGFGFMWGINGWLLPNFLAANDPAMGDRLRMRVAKELKTTFASNYTDEISLSEALDADVARQYFAKSTGQKFLICPQEAV